MLSSSVSMFRRQQNTVLKLFLRTDVSSLWDRAHTVCFYLLPVWPLITSSAAWTASLA